MFLQDRTCCQDTRDSQSMGTAWVGSVYQRHNCEVVCKRNLRSCTVGFGPTDIEISLARQPLLLPLNYSTSTHVNLYRNADHAQSHCVMHCVELR